MDYWKVHEMHLNPSDKVNYTIIDSSRGRVAHVPSKEYWCDFDTIEAKMYKNNAEAIADIGNNLQHITYNKDIDKEDVLKDILDVLQHHNVCTV